MNVLVEFLPVVATGVGMAFGFGKQSAAISVLRRDMDAMHSLHRETISLLNEIDRKIIRLDQIIEISRERDSDITSGRRRDT